MNYEIIESNLNKLASLFGDFISSDEIENRIAVLNSQLEEAETNLAELVAIKGEIISSTPVNDSGIAQFELGVGIRRANKLQADYDREMPIIQTELAKAKIRRNNALNTVHNLNYSISIKEKLGEYDISKESVMLEAANNRFDIFESRLFDLDVKEKFLEKSLEDVKADLEKLQVAVTSPELYLDNDDLKNVMKRIEQIEIEVNDLEYEKDKLNAHYTLTAKRILALLSLGNEEDAIALIDSLEEDITSLPYANLGIYELDDIKASLEEKRNNLVNKTEEQNKPISVTDLSVDIKKIQDDMLSRYDVFNEELKKQSELRNNDYNNWLKKLKDIETQQANVNVLVEELLAKIELTSDVKLKEEYQNAYDLKMFEFNHIVSAKDLLFLTTKEIEKELLNITDLLSANIKSKMEYEKQIGDITMLPLDNIEVVYPQDLVATREALSEINNDLVIVDALLNLGGTPKDLFASIKENFSTKLVKEETLDDVHVMKSIEPVVVSDLKTEVNLFTTDFDNEPLDINNEIEEKPESFAESLIEEFSPMEIQLQEPKVVDQETYVLEDVIIEEKPLTNNVDERLFPLREVTDKEKIVATKELNMEGLQK